MRWIVSGVQKITDRMTDECLCCESCNMSDIEAIDTREEGRVWQRKREVNADRSTRVALICSKKLQSTQPEDKLQSMACTHLEERVHMRQSDQHGAAQNTVVRVRRTDKKARVSSVIVVQSTPHNTRWLVTDRDRYRNS